MAPQGDTPRLHRPTGSVWSEHSKQLPSCWFFGSFIFSFRASLLTPGKVCAKQVMQKGGVRAAPFVSCHILQAGAEQTLAGAQGHRVSPVLLQKIQPCATLPTQPCRSG